MVGTCRSFPIQAGQPRLIKFGVFLFRVHLVYSQCTLMTDGAMKIEDDQDKSLDVRKGNFEFFLLQSPCIYIYFVTKASDLFQLFINILILRSNVNEHIFNPIPHGQLEARNC